MRRVDWDDIRVFLEIGRVQSISLASKRLHLDHSTVSRRLSKLEMILGHRLIERRPDGIVLTSAGRELLAHSEAMETQLIAAEASMFGQIGNTRETVCLSTYEGISSFFIASRLHSFSEKNPQIDVEILTSLQPVRIERRDADVFLSFYEPEGKSLHVELAGSMKLFLCASEQYLAEHGTPENEHQLRGHLYTTYVRESVTIESVRWLDEIVSHAPSRLRSSSMITQMNIAAAGGGIVLLPAFCPIEQAGLKPILANSVSVEREIWVSTHRDLITLPKVKKLVQFLKDTIAAERDLLLGRRFRQ